MELHNSTSTQSLGVNSTTGQSIVFSKSSKRLLICVTLACVLLIAACVILSVLYVEQVTKTQKLDAHNKHNSSSTSSQNVCFSADCLEIAAEFTKNINRSVDPCDDYYRYACGGWIKDNPIPPSENQHATYLKATKLTSVQLRGLLDEATNLKPGPLKKARDYYKACMDEREADRTATDQIILLLRELGSWALDNETWNETKWEWKEALLKIQKVFSVQKSPLFGLEVVEDPTNSSRYLLKIDKPSLSFLREQYIEKNEKNEKARKAYLEFMSKVVVLLGKDNETAYKAMDDVLYFEELLAKSMPPKRILQKQLYDTYEIGKFDNSSSDFMWLQHINKFYKSIGQSAIQLKPSELVIIPSPSYLNNMTRIVANQTKSTLSNYFGWTVIRNLIVYLSTPFREAEMKYKRKATNTAAPKPRWLQCIKTTEQREGLTYAVGYMYIQKVFDKSSIPVIKNMMDEMRAAFREEVESLSWIDKTTRRGVFEKEESMIEKIGFPKLCSNLTLLEEYYSGLEVSDRYYLLNEVNVSRWYTKKMLSKLRNPIDRDSWYSGPQMVNAFYLRERNEINIMAGILQPPFFYGKDAPRVVNYGAIGMVLAHELTHGFDSAGRRFNKYGEITTDLGWTNNSMDQFKARAQCIVDQYNKFELKIGKETKNVDGKQTLDENIADNGGFKIALRAYKNWINEHGPEKMVPGLKKTNEQMFFLSFAQMWCSSYTPAATLVRASVDTHAMPRYRVLGVLMNSEAFAKAYNCPVGSKMNPEPSSRCRVW